MATSLASDVMILIASRDLLTLTTKMKVILEWFWAPERVIAMAADLLLDRIEQPGETRRFALKRAGRTRPRALAVQAIMAWLDRPALPDPSAGLLNTNVLWESTRARHILLTQSL